uniref:Uncharacterized protein n=1 Tax=Parascaris equorum TaxID=6256 RepID=A0A914RMG1_PAREQ
MGAYLTLASVTATWLVGRRMNLARRAKFVLHSTMIMSYTQVLLGIAALVNFTCISILSNII